MREACIQCAHLLLTSAETKGWEWCDLILELWQQHVQESSGSVGAGWFETWAGYDRVAVVKLGVNSGSGDDGSCFGIEVLRDTAKLTNMVISRFGHRWDLVRKGEVFVEYEAQISSRVSSDKWGLVDFGQLFTETSLQKFSLGGEDLQSTRTKFDLDHCQGDLYYNKGRECHLCRVAGNTVWSHVACEFP